MFISTFFTDPTTYISWVALIMFSICVHEFSHAWTALKQGDSTAADLGYLTLNPLQQMGMFSIVLLCIIGICWGSVPVNPRRMRRRYSHALVSFAGPAANILLVLAFSFLSAIFSQNLGMNAGLSKSFANFFFLGAALNGFLFLLNMLPLPILDGWTVYSFLFPPLKRVPEEFQRGATFLLIMLFMMTNLVSYFLGAGVFGARILVRLFGG